ncbi:MAG: NAD(P)H-binding protein [Microscillaceae bacterium]|nr:NAD(P)H-binding protein [Microscillaceae bacterium]
MKKIAIIGATGMLGQPVTSEFIKAGFEVTSFARNAATANQIFGPSIKIIEGKLQDTDKIRQLLEGQDGLYLNLSVEQKSSKSEFQPEREGLDNILDIAKKYNIKRIGYLSSLVHFYQGQNGFDWWVFDIKQKAVEKIKNSGITYSIFYPSTFMESFDKGAYRQGNNIALAGVSRYKMFLISGSDYGKQVVKAFQLNNDNHEYVVQGQEGFTADEAAKFYIDNYNKKKINLMKAPLALLKFLGLFNNKFNYGAKIVEALNSYPEKFEAEKAWQDLGKPQTKFIDYIQQSQ